MPKRDLTVGLSSPAAQPIVRGKGYSLSTTNADADLADQAVQPEQVAEATKPQVAKEPGIQRENAKLDPALIKAFKKLAVEQDRKLYEVMEEALREYLDRHQ